MVDLDILKLMMSDIPAPLLRSGHSYIKDAQCAEANEKSIL